MDGEVGAGEVVVLDEPLPLMPEELPEDGVLLVPPPEELEPDLLKCASHSEREIEPSLLVSTAEKLGADEPALELAPALGEDVLPDDMLPDEPVDELPDAPDEVLCDAFGVVAEPLPEAPAEPEAPEVDWLEPVAEGEDEEEEDDCATASVESANSTAAVRVPAVLIMDVVPLEMS